MDDTICHWTTPAARLRVRGADAATFLQGQFSNDLRRVEPCPVTYGLWLNHKGRALADSHLLQHGPESFEIVSLRSSSGAIRERLEAYIIADDVAVEDDTAGLAGVIMAGPGAGEAVRALFGRQPEPRTFTAVGDLTVIPARCDVAASWLVYGPHVDAAETRRRLADAGVREVSAEELARRRINAGLPLVPDELGPDDLPMEGGLEHDAISFTKGCYLGQEVMARLHNLGQVRRRLFIVDADASAGALVRGTPLFSGTQKLGELRVLVRRDGDASSEAVGFAMLQAHAVEPGTVLSAEPGGAGCLRVRRIAEGRSP